jgi:hypothetical protein
MTAHTDDRFDQVDVKSIRGLMAELERQLEQLRGHL